MLEQLRVDQLMVLASVRLLPAADLTKVDAVAEQQVKRAPAHRPGCECLPTDPHIPNPVVLDLTSSMIKGGKKREEEEEEEELRPPGPKQHVAAMLHSRIYTGGAGAKKRLKGGFRNVVYHDAAD